MRHWPALILSPILALTNLSLAYALVTPSCSRQSIVVLHTVAALSLVLSLLFTWAAWRDWQLQRLQAGASDDDAVGGLGFIAGVSAMAGLFSSIVILAQWLPIWVLSPCVS